MNARVLLGSLLLPLLVGCGNPALDVKIEQLKPDGLEPSEFHRSGQPCTWCHGPYKGASPEIVVGGTIFQVQADKPVPVEGVKIILTDSLGNVNAVRPPGQNEKRTNCAGNFYFTRDEVQKFLGLDTVAFPLAVDIVCPDPMNPNADGNTLSMNTRISREGSCGGCHQGNQDQDSPGWVNCASTAFAAPTPRTCPKAFPQGNN